MSEVRQHNRDRLAKNQLESKQFRSHGTQSEEKRTRNIGTMSELIRTRNFGNEAQPQSSSTQTSDLLPQRQDERDLKQSMSQRSRHESRIDGHYPSQRTTSLDHRNKYVPSSSMVPRHIGYSDYEPHQPSHLSQYDDVPRGRHRTTKYDDYQRSTTHRPHSSSQTRQRIPSATSPHRTPPPPAEYRSTSPKDRYHARSPSNHYRLNQSQRSRSPSPPIQKHTSTSTHRHRTISPPLHQRHSRSPSSPIQKHTSTSTHRHHTISPPPPQRHSRSPSPPIQKHTSTSANRHRTISPPPQRRSRVPERSPSPSPSRQHIQSSRKVHHTPSPPADYRSTSPDNRYYPLSSSSPPKNYSRKPKDQRPTVSAETDTSLDGMKPQQHRGVQQESPSTRDYGITTNAEKKHSPQNNHPINLNTRPTYSQYQTLDSSLPKRQGYIITSPYEDNRTLLRDDQPSSTRENYRLQPVRNDSYANDYEEIPSQHNESISPEFNPSFNRRKEYTPKPFKVDQYEQPKRTVKHRPEEEEQQITLNLPNEISNDEYISQLPIGGSVSIPSTTVIQPDTLPRSYDHNKFPPHQKHDRLDNRGKITQVPVHHGQQRTTSIIDSPLFHIATENIIHQSPDNEFTTPFKTRYIHESNDFTTDNDYIRSSTLKRDDLRSRSNRILLLPVINSSRTYVFEKQSLPGNQLRQSRTNGNFYLATSPALRSLNSSFQLDDSEIDPLAHIIDSNNLTGHELRSQVV